MENSNNSGKMIGALIIGAVLGGVLGILFAPEKGSETRKIIADETDDLTKTLKEKFNAYIDEAKKGFEAAADKEIVFTENQKEK